MQTADIFDFFASPNIKKDKLQLPLNVQKPELFQLQGALPSDPRPRSVSFAYCSINTVSLLCDIVYLS